MGTVRTVYTLDIEAMLAEFDSSEARALDGSFVVPTNADFLFNLFGAFVPLN